MSAEIDNVVPDEWSVTDDDEALAGLVNLIVVLADNKFFLGRRLSEWLSGGPSLESAVALAAISQEELGHARALYPLLEEMPIVDTPAPPDPRRGWRRGGGRRGRAVVGGGGGGGWGGGGGGSAGLILVDPALTVL